MLNRRTLLSALMTLALGVWATGTALMQQDPELATSVNDGFTIAMVHHNLHDRSLRKNLMHGLHDRHDVVRRCAHVGVDLMLHGHTHQAHRFRHEDMWIIGCGSSTWTGPHPDRLARYNIYHVDEGRPEHVEMHRYDLQAGTFLGLEDRTTPT